MSLQPEGEELRKAVKWISEEKAAYPDKKVSILIGKASVRFDLSPKDESFLFRFFKKES
jgi:hypothetical protein